VGDLDASPPRQVAVVVELLLQLQGLVPGVGLAAAFSVGAWERNADLDHLGGLGVVFWGLLGWFARLLFSWLPSKHPSTAVPRGDKTLGGTLQLLTAFLFI